MLDYKLIELAYQNDGFYSLQLEIGDVCHQNCIYCYMNALEISQNQLTDDLIIKILYQSKDLGISAIEWLGGEPLLRENVFHFLEIAQKLGFRNNMWTGGLPLEDKTIAQKLADYCQFGLISFHLSTINPQLYELMHPNRSTQDIYTIINGVEYLLKIGYPASQILNSVTFTGLQTADDMIKTITYFYENYGIQTSINVYHTYLRPGFKMHDLEKFIPSPKETAKILNFYKKLIKVDELPMNCVNKQYCSATIAVLNNGYVTPCATIREKNPLMNVQNFDFIEIVDKHRDYLTFKKLKDKENLPPDCRVCNLNNRCWGCRSRSYAIGDGLFGKDPRCFRKYSSKN